MKKTAVTFLVCTALTLCLCGKNSGTGPSSAETYVADTMAVRQILDANSLTSLPISSVVVPLATQDRIYSLLFTPATLSGGSIHTLPSSISTLTELVSLTLDSNQISTLPTVIGGLTKLRALSIEHNNLAQVPNELGKCTKLTLLHLGYNQLTSIPAQVCSLDSLHSLFIDHNAITTSGLPASLASNTAIRGALKVANNRICNVTDPLLSFLNLNAELNWDSLQTCP
jgi:Leucine-rich repeat (LRR) protein